jgi:hypothetical protein
VAPEAGLAFATAGEDNPEPQTVHRDLNLSNLINFHSWSSAAGHATARTMRAEGEPRASRRWRRVE